MATLVIATNNAGKAREYREMLAPFGVTVKTLADLPRFAIDECGTSFEENALIKARTAVAKLDLPVLADDSGLVVDALNGAPGVHSARYAGDHDDAANNAKLLRELTGVPATQRTAHFHTTIVALKPDGAKLETSGRVEGQILTQLRGQNGFGYDPLFMPKEFPGRSMAELTPAEKNQISHRGRALQAFMEQFAGWWQA